MIAVSKFRPMDWVHVVRLPGFCKISLFLESRAISIKPRVLCQVLPIQILFWI